MVLDSTGTDVTADTAELFLFAQPAAWESDAATATTITITIDDKNSELLANDAYVFVMVAGFINPLDPTNPVFSTSTIIFAVMEKMEPLFDVAPFAVMIDTYLAMADPYFEKYFYHAFTASFLVFGLIIPGVVTSGQLFTCVFMFSLWAAMFPINGPLLVMGVSYFGLIGW